MCAALYRALMATVGAEAAGQTITATKAQAGGDNKSGSGAGSKARPVPINAHQLPKAMCFGVPRFDNIPLALGHLYQMHGCSLDLITHRFNLCRVFVRTTRSNSLWLVTRRLCPVSSSVLMVNGWQAQLPTTLSRYGEHMTGSSNVPSQDTNW